jgi:FkbM family methyltransferase
MKCAGETYGVTLEIEMKEWSGIWFPDGETHLIDWMEQTGQQRDGMPCYQKHKYDAALEWVRPERRVAVDVGAHIGQWSYNMALDFAKVIAFEPVPAYADCWHRNVKKPNAQLIEIALGQESAVVDLHHGTPGSHGDTWVASSRKEANAAQDVPMMRLDDYRLDEVDFIKIDCEGYEYFILMGAIETIIRCKPCVIVEQKTGMARKFGLGDTDAVSLLQRLGASLRRGLQGDYILSW